MKKLIYCLKDPKLFRLYDLIVILTLAFFVNKLSDLTVTIDSLDSFMHIIQYFFGLAIIISFYLIYQLYIDCYEDARGAKSDEPFIQLYKESIDEDIGVFKKHYMALVLNITAFITNLICN
jgi:hypothetical protein